MENILKKPCKAHISSVHEGKKTFRCEMCGKTFFDWTKLTQHIAVIHEGMKPYKCDICDYIGSQNSDFINHIVSVHEGV